MTTPPVHERRRRPTPPVSRYLFWGRRRRPPAGTGGNYYLDRPAPEALKSAVLLICLSALDALLSLWLFSTGHFHELNPLLRWGLELGDGVFFAIKMGLTVTAVFVLLIHWNFVIARRQLRVVWLIWTLNVAYLLAVFYETLLLIRFA
ncbi:MAG TPA: DUF5658 family protein [Acidobacteriota bacterium]|nr:DUF5658 family protein [Acidobacteriota bacterium]HRR56896.1 DUF5658 family protein [Acidobacteriota bacterium]HRV07136.1 DUF5658 family protein [Acidobacteriota bacterium]